MKYFKNIKSLEDLKSQYKDLLKINHPDNGGEVEKMQEINVQYDALFKVWKDRHEEKTGEQVTETAESTRSQFYTEFGWEGSNICTNLLVYKTELCHNKSQGVIYYEYKYRRINKTFARRIPAGML